MSKLTRLYDIYPYLIHFICRSFTVSINFLVDIFTGLGGKLKLFSICFLKNMFTVSKVLNNSQLWHFCHPKYERQTSNLCRERKLTNR